MKKIGKRGCDIDLRPCRQMYRSIILYRSKQASVFILLTKTDHIVVDFSGLKFHFLGFVLIYYLLCLFTKDCCLYSIYVNIQ